MGKELLLATLLLAAGTALAGRLPSQPDAEAVKAALGQFTGTAESMDGPVRWEGRAISVIGLAEVSQGRWAKAYADTKPSKVIRVFARSREGRLASFDYAAYRASKGGAPAWRLVEWHEMSLAETEQAVSQDLGRDAFRRHFGSPIFAGLER